MKLSNLPFFLLVFLSVTHAFAQQDTTIFFSKKGSPVNSKKDAESYQAVKQSGDSLFTLTPNYLRNGKWVETEKSIFHRVNDSVFLVNVTYPSGKTDTFYRQVHRSDTGFFISDLRKGILTSRGFSYLIAPLVKQGIWIYYLPETGGLDRDESFSNNQITETRYWDEESNTFITDVMTVAESAPEYKEGDEALYKLLTSQIVYPDEAKEKGEQGRVFVSFIVMENGSLKRIRVIHGPSASLNDEALRVIALTDGDWKPATNKGEAVRIIYVLPIMFSLQ